MPEEHTCYRCLLGQGEPQTMESLKELTKKRRVMHILQAEGPKKASDIANSMRKFPNIPCWVVADKYLQR